jgi:hypothetical protein
MRRLLFVLGLTVSSLVAAAESNHLPVVHNSAMRFVEFWDANKDKPKAEQLAQFKAQVAPRVPGFYEIERFGGEFTQQQLDAHIDGAIAEFPMIREAYIKKAQQFETELPQYIASFKARFPDYEPSGEMLVLHSLGEMDGGTRWINGKLYLVFGIDGMVKYHGAGNESAFFHHELFHTYHKMEGCGDYSVWAALWQEGLATYVSRVMNPDANAVELLLDMPDHMADQTQAVLPAALAQLESVLDKNDFDTYASLFYSRGDGNGLPRRRGYYLGYLVAQEAAKTQDLQALAKLGCAAVRELVHKKVRELRSRVQ